MNNENPFVDSVIADSSSFLDLAENWQQTGGSSEVGLTTESIDKSIIHELEDNCKLYMWLQGWIKEVLSVRSWECRVDELNQPLCEGSLIQYEWATKACCVRRLKLEFS